ncbi:MAG: response regulator [Dongiaceae bacterium]
MYLRDDSLNVTRAEVLDCIDDERAVAKALALMLAAPTYIRGVEIWQQERYVFELSAAAGCRGKQGGTKPDRFSDSNSCAERLLVADDNKDVLDITRRIGLGLGYSVQAVDRGRQFMASYVLERPDCIVLDLNLPDIAGLSLLQWLLDVGCEAKVIVTSGTVDDRVLVQLFEFARQGLAIATLHKPFQLSDLTKELYMSATADVSQRSGDRRIGKKYC